MDLNNARRSAKHIAQTMRRVECKGWYIASSALQTMGITAVELGVGVT